MTKAVGCRGVGRGSNNNRCDLGKDLVKKSYQSFDRGDNLLQCSSIERRKQKKIAVEKKRRARMNDYLSNMRRLLQQQNGELEDADTAQILDMAVNFLRNFKNMSSLLPWLPDVGSFGEVPHPHPVLAPTPVSYPAGSGVTLTGQYGCESIDFSPALPLDQLHEQASLPSVRLHGKASHWHYTDQPATWRPEGLLLRTVAHVSDQEVARRAYWRPW